LILKVVSESRVTRATSMPILVSQRPPCSRLRPDVRDRQTDVRRLYPRDGGIIIIIMKWCQILMTKRTWWLQRDTGSAVKTEDQYGGLWSAWMPFPGDFCQAGWPSVKLLQLYCLCASSD